MKITHSILLLLYCSYDGESSYLIFSSTSQTWFSANQKCKTEYNGFLADIDEIKDGSNNRKFTTCLNGSDELWTGELLYTTGYIAYKGCYSVPGFVDHGAVQMEKMTIAKCQLYCRYDQYFAIKGKYCKCITSNYVLNRYATANLTDCSLICSGQYCGFYGGNDTVSVYVKNDLCVIGKCVKPMSGPFRMEYGKIKCETQMKISAYCENGAEQSNVGSWNDAVRFCVYQASNLTTLTSDVCMYGLQVWQNERKYQDAIRVRGTIITEDATFSCFSSNLSDLIGKEETSSNCHLLKPFVCVSDTDKAGICSIRLTASNNEKPITERVLANFVASSTPSHISQRINEVTDNNGIHVNKTSYTPPATQEYSTMTREYSTAVNRSMQSKSKTSSNNTPIIVGVTVGVTCVIAVVVLASLIYWKRTGCVQRKLKSTTNTSRDLTDSSNTRSYERSQENGGDCGKTSKSWESVYDEVRDTPKDTEVYYNERFENDSTEKDDHTYLELGQREESHYDVIIKQKGHQREGYEVPISKRLYENIKR